MNLVVTALLMAAAASVASANEAVCTSLYLNPMTFNAFSDTKIDTTVPGLYVAAPLPACAVTALKLPSNQEILIGGHGSGSIIGINAGSSSKGCTDTSGGINAQCMATCQALCCFNPVCKFAQIHESTETSTTDVVGSVTARLYYCEMFAAGIPMESDSDDAICQFKYSNTALNSDTVVPDNSAYSDPMRQAFCSGLTQQILGVTPQQFQEVSNCANPAVGRRLGSSIAPVITKILPDSAEIIATLEHFNQTLTNITMAMHSYLSGHHKCLRKVESNLRSQAKVCPPVVFK